MPDPTVATSFDHLGALTAEHVMGWSVCHDKDCQGCNALVWRQRSPDEWIVRTPDLTDVYFAELMEHAWLVVKKMRADGWWFGLLTLTDTPGMTARAEFHRPPNPERYGGIAPGPTDPAAICLAALEAVGHPVVLELGEE